MTVSGGVRVLPCDLEKVLVYHSHEVCIDVVKSLGDQHLQANRANHEITSLVEEEVVSCRQFIMLGLSDMWFHDLLNWVLL